MAQEPAAPWSRWDAPGFQFISSNTEPPARYYDTGSFTGLQGTLGNGLQGTQVGSQPVRQPFVQGILIDQRVNPDNPDFLDCVYGAQNTAGRVVEQCLRDIGCCATTCCDNLSWQDKYRWAVALIVIFCILVVIAFVAWLFCWLFNRAKDKRQKKLMAGSPRGLSPVPSQVSVSGRPGGQSGIGYYPYVGGPKQ